MAHKEYNMGTHYCTYCGQYCITKYLKKKLKFLRESGKIFKSGKVFDLDERNDEQYNRGMRNGFYKMAPMLFNDLTKSFFKGLLPACMVEMAREKWPSPNNIYHGYPWTRDEMKLMELPNNHMAWSSLEDDEKEQRSKNKKMRTEKV